jgi:hypothetical protein
MKRKVVLHIAMSLDGYNLYSPNRMREIIFCLERILFI